MTKRSPFEDLPDRARVCVLLRADGWSYDEIAAFLDCSIRCVRLELEKVSRSLPGLLDHRRPDNAGRSLRVVYVLGLIDGGASPDELTDYLDAIVTRSAWIRSRMRSPLSGSA